MPMINSSYPADWPEISLRERARAHWMCEECGADCWDPMSPKNILTVHHLDHDPSNCTPETMIALCTVCHLRRDAAFHARNARITRAKKQRGPVLPLPWSWEV